MISKKNIRDGFEDFLRKKVSAIEEELKAIRESAAAETKSSMGDKYETSREMMMQERNRLGSQINVLTDQLAALKMIDVEKNYSEVSYGCMVHTDNAFFFISAAIGQLKVEDQVFFAISGEAPLAKAMMGRKEGDSFSFNKKSFTIKRIA